MLQNPLHKPISIGRKAIWFSGWTARACGYRGSPRLTSKGFHPDPATHQEDAATGTEKVLRLCPVKFGLKQIPNQSGKVTKQSARMTHWQRASLLTDVSLLVVLDVLSQLEVASDDRHLPEEEITLKRQVRDTLPILMA